MWQWLFGVAVGIVLAVFGPSVFSLQRRRQRREQLIARYAELLAAASEELDRLRRLAVQAEDTEAEESTTEARPAAGAEAGRGTAVAADCHQLRQRAFAVRLLERDRALADQVKVLAAWEPLDGQAAGSESGTAPTPSAQALREQAAAFERMIDELCERVRQTHGEALWEGGWRAGWNGLTRLFRTEPALSEPEDR